MSDFSSASQSQHYQSEATTAVTNTVPFDLASAISLFRDHKARTSNTGTSTSNLRSNGSDADWSMNCNVDYLDVTVYGKMDSSGDWSRILEVKKAAAKEESMERFLYLPIDDGEDGETIPVEVCAYAGKSKGSNSFQYRLETGEFTLFLNPDVDTEGDMDGDVRARKRPVARIEFKGLWCMQRGWKDMPGEVWRWLKVFGVLPCDDGLQVSRLDICIDVHGRDVWQSIRPIMTQSVVSRANKFGMQGDLSTGIETFYLGKRTSAHQLCIYDKVAELQQAKNAVKRRLFKQMFFGDEEAEFTQPITRYEFRLSRDAIRDTHGCHDMYDTFDKLTDIVRYLTENWYRETAKTVDKANNNQAKAEVSSYWRLVCAGIQKTFDKPVSFRVRRSKRVGDLATYARSIRGYVASYCAASGQTFLSLPDALLGLADELGRQGGEFTEVLSKRVHDFATKRGLGFFDVLRQCEERTAVAGEFFGG